MNATSLFARIPRVILFVVATTFANLGFAQAPADPSAGLRFYVNIDGVSIESLFNIEGLVERQPILGRLDQLDSAERKVKDGSESEQYKKEMLQSIEDTRKILRRRLARTGVVERVLRGVDPDLPTYEQFFDNYDAKIEAIEDLLKEETQKPFNETNARAVAAYRARLDELKCEQALEIGYTGRALNAIRPLVRRAMNNFDDAEALCEYYAGMSRNTVDQGSMRSAFSIMLANEIREQYKAAPAPPTSEISNLLKIADELQKRIESARPYEMNWANRRTEVREPIVDFENLDGWRVETKNAIATFERSDEQHMYGGYVGKLTYRRGESKDETIVDIRPPKEIPLPSDANAYSCWIVGNNWGWTVDPTTPRVVVYALVKETSGKELQLPLATVTWKEWFLCYDAITADTRKTLGNAPTFTGFRVVGGKNEEDRTIYFDSFCFFNEERKPLEFVSRAKPGIDLFDGQPLGINDGEGRLPFPTNEDTILPDSSENLRTPMFHFYGDSCDFVYTGSEGDLVYYYKPKTGTWSDFTAKWRASEDFAPLDGGGVVKLVAESGATEDVERAELLDFKQTEDGARALWRLSSANATADVEYRMQIKGKSLIIDTIAKGGRIGDVSFGVLSGVANAESFAIPYYLYDYGRRPGVALITTRLPEKATPRDLKDQAKLFASAHIDWYRSGASYLRGAHGVETRGGKVVVTLNGGAEYRPKTDGKRNDVYERFILTVSPKFEETLPTIANPRSPYKSVAGSGVWRSHGASTREGDASFWRNVWRYGMRHMIITDHEVCWRDGGESFTFRTRPAPKKGEDAGWQHYSRFMQDELGFVYGPYNNFTDFAPVNEFWSPDMVNRRADWTLQHAWMRCYAPKPTRAVEFCERLTPIVQRKFKFSCAYCDVHSSVPPWTRTDYDERVPGAGTFMSVYYPYGEIFLLQKKNWGGPTYSEGPHHCFYAGLTDGNYAQDQPYNMYLNPWLVDFDLRKIHDLEVDFGMGNVGMFAPGYNPATDEEREALLDRFVTATAAFGHSGFFAIDYGIRAGMRSYFLIQQIASRYTQSAVDKIYYLGDKEGVPTWMETSEALIADAVKNSCLKVVYKDGTTVFANGSTAASPYELRDEELTRAFGREVALGANEFFALTADGAIRVESTRGPTDRRYDYCESPEYIYLDGRDAWIERDKACGSGAGACLILGNGKYEIIPYKGAELGFKIAKDSDEVAIEALDYDMKVVGAAKARRSRGYVFVEPVEGAFSYRVTVNAKDGATHGEKNAGAKFVVGVGERIALPDCGENAEFCATEAPADFKSAEYVEIKRGDRAIWRVKSDAFFHAWFDGANASRDFLVAPNAEYDFEMVDSGTLRATKRGFRALDGEVDADERIALDAPTVEGEETREWESTEKGETARFELKFDVVKTRKTLDDDFLNSKRYRAFVQRQGEEASEQIDGTGASAFIDNATCGGTTRVAVNAHPPYQNGPEGRTYLEFRLAVPETPSSFRAVVGKRDGSDIGDGILFQISAVDGSNEERVLASTTLAEHAWRELEADLSEFAGREIALRVVADRGGNTSGDWAAIAHMDLIENQETMIRSIKSVRLVERKSSAR